MQEINLLVTIRQMTAKEMLIAYIKRVPSKRVIFYNDILNDLLDMTTAKAKDYDLHFEYDSERENEFDVEIYFNGMYHELSCNYSDDDFYWMSNYSLPTREKENKNFLEYLQAILDAREEFILDNPTYDKG